MPDKVKKVLRSIIAGIPYVGPVVSQYFSQLSSEEILKVLEEIRNLKEHDIEELSKEKQVSSEQILQMIASIERCLKEIVKEQESTLLVDNNTKIAKYRTFLENFLRGFVTEKLKEHYGEGWWRKNVPHDVQEKCAERKKERIEKGEITEAEPLINFADFPDFKEIFFYKMNWYDIFSQYYGRRKEQKYIIETKFFPELYRIRTDEAHSRKIPGEDVKKFEVYSLELLCIEEHKNQFKKIIESWEIPKLKPKKPISEKIETWIARNVRFPRKEDFEKGLVYSDETTKKTIEDMLESKRYYLLYGAPASRKTTFSLSFGLDLLKKGYSVLYFDIKDEQDIDWEHFLDEVKSRDLEKVLFIIDDCHKSTRSVYEFFHQVKRETKNAKFLFVSRKVSMIDPDYDYFEEFESERASLQLKPADDVFKGIIEQFCISNGIENYTGLIGDLSKIMKICGNNVLFLKYLLETWNDILKVEKEEVLSNVTKERFYEKISKKYNLAENRDLFKLCAIYQFEAPIACDFVLGQIPSEKIRRWLEEGLIFESQLPYYTMPHSSLARVILRAGENRRLLMFEGDYSSRSLEEYTTGILEKYLRLKAIDLPQIISNIYRDDEIKITSRLFRRDVLLPAVKDYFDGEASINLKINFLVFLSHREFEEQTKKEIIKSIDLNKLAEEINRTPFVQFQQLTSLLNNIGDRRKELTEKLDFKKIAEAISNAPPKRFQDMANLFNALGSSKINLVLLLDYDKIKEKANQISPDDIRGLTLFMARLDKEHRDILIRDVDWASLSVKSPLNASSLRAVGGILENLWKQANMLCEEDGKKRVAQHLRDHENDVVKAIENAFEQIKEHLRSYASMYAAVGKFAWHYAQTDRESAFKIITKTRNKLIECFKIAPVAYKYVGQLVNVFHGLDPNLAYSFLADNKIRGRIIWSINNHDWSANMEGLKHLVEAIYRSAPRLWKINYLRWITVDLTSLELDSIYRKVDEEKTGVL